MPETLPTPTAEPTNLQEAAQAYLKAPTREAKRALVAKFPDLEKFFSPANHAEDPKPAN